MEKKWTAVIKAKDKHQRTLEIQRLNLALCTARFQNEI